MKITRGQENRSALAQKAYRASELAEMTPAQAERWVEEHVNDVASAKRVLKVLAHAIVALARYRGVGD